ncbi:MAG: VPLPA-CTERM-specific exosortase XrtD [Steroidobacteraceae bacterium]
MSVQSMRVPQTSVIRTGLLALLAVFIGILGFSGALTELVYRWNQQEEYSHGFLIPVVTAWLLWTRRDALRANIGQPSWIGPVLILLAIALHITGELSAIFILSQIGFVVALMGIALGTGGYSLLKVAFIPIAFLLFAIPLPYFIDSVLTLRLQLVSSELWVFYIRMFEIPVYRDGNIIDMGNYKLQVVEACSGLRYLYPLLSLSFLAAYLFHAPLWQRGLVLLSSIPIAIGMNGFRIGVVGILVDRWGTQMAEGVLHFFEGWVIFLACAALLTAEMYLLAWISRRRFFDVFYFPKVAVRLPGRLGAKLVGKSPLVACLFLLCVGGLAVFSTSGRSEIIPERTSFVEFPARIGQWQGHVSSLDIETERGLGLDDYILSDYSRSDGKLVNLYAAYYASQRKGVSPHSPIVCIPGGGWAITDLEQMNFFNLGEERSLNRVIIQKGSVKELVYYWFDERGRKIANEFWAKFYLLADAIVKNRTDGALVRLTTQVLPGETERDADQRLQTFMQDAVPRLSAFLPSDTSPQVKSVSYRPQRPQS